MKRNLSRWTTGLIATSTTNIDASEAVEAIFGEGACIKLFGHKYPQVVQIAEFVEDFRPVAAAIISASGLGNDLASDEANKVIAMPEAW